MGGGTVALAQARGNSAGKSKKRRDKPAPRLFLTKISAVFAVLAGCSLVFHVETDRHIIDHGVRVEGIVESADYYHSGKRTYTTAVQVRYDRPDGTSARFEVKLRGSYDQGPKAKAGEKVLVSYDPYTNPEEAVVEKWRARYGHGPVVVPFLLLALGMFEALFTAASVPAPYPPQKKA